jgi:hypothetical protein
MSMTLNVILDLVFLNRAVQVQSSSRVSLIAFIRKRIWMYHETDSSVALLLLKGIGAR